MLRKARALARAVVGDSVSALMDEFMLGVEASADEEDWAESDNWVGRIVLKRQEKDEEHVYHILDGKMTRSDSKGPYVASIIMSVDTFLSIMDSALKGRGEQMWVRQYGAGHIVYQGDHWVVDSERFRKVLSRMGRK